MSGKLGVGAWAGLGSILGLLAGSMVGAAISGNGRKGAAAAVLPALAGTALGAFAGAALSAAEPNTTTVTTTTTGAGALPGAGLGALPQGEPSRFDGRYAKAGVQPPHKCTAASAANIAKQLDPSWRVVIPIQPVFGKSSGEGLGRGWVENMVDVTTPMGAKKIPIWMYGSGQMALQCPYTGEYFFFSRAVA